jgi:hypothetical protein
MSDNKLSGGQGAAMLRHCLTLCAMGGLAVAAQAAEMPRGRPEVFKKLLDCRAITEAAQRLACYDGQVAALESAEAKQDVVVVDRKQIREARKSLFGLTLPKIDLFGGSDDDSKPQEEGFSEIETTVSRASLRGDGKWFLVLADGAKWVQTERKTMVRDPKAGSTIKIRRAALGSYMANIDGQNAIRVRREN